MRRHEGTHNLVDRLLWLQFRTEPPRTKTETKKPNLITNKLLAIIYIKIIITTIIENIKQQYHNHKNDQIINNQSIVIINNSFNIPIQLKFDFTP